MKITRVEAIPYAIPYRKPLSFASGQVAVAEHLLIRIHTDAGLIGQADAPPRPFTYGETQASIHSMVVDHLGPQLEGLAPLQRSRAHEIMNRVVGNPVAKAAIDLALWDIIGQSLGVSVTDLLGGYSDRMRVSHMLGFDAPDAMVAEAERIRDTYGITTFKVKVGRNPIDADVAVCRSLRTAFGNDIDLYIDGNRGWSAADAARALRAMDDLDLLFAEELCPADDVLGRRWLVERCPIPFFADESVPTPADLTREVLAGSANGVSIKVSRSGITGSQSVLSTAEHLGIPVVIGNQIDTQIGSLCSTAFGAAFATTAARPGELSNYLDMTDDLLAEPLEITGGELHVRQGPGLDIEIDESKLDRYRLDR